MVQKPLDQLLAKLCAGDAAAAGQVFVAFEPYLRRAVRRQLPPMLRSKFDSADVLQSVWADVIRAFRQAGCRFTDVDHLRGFLYVATRNRLVDRIRQHRTSAEREEPLLNRQAASTEPRPSEIAVADDLWRRMLATCSPEHHEILELRRQGYLLGEIAERVGLHCDSIRRILRNLARQLAFADSPERAQAES